VFRDVRSFLLKLAAVHALPRGSRATANATPRSGMPWRDDGLICTVRALTEHTDICTTVLACPPTAMEQLQRVSCTTPAPAVIRELQSLFGTVRRSYRPLLELHPSVPLELAALLRRRSAPPSRGLDIVLCRCREPLGPLLRLAPALLPRHARLRIFVYERCGWQPQGDGGGGGGGGSPDLRDRMYGVVRRALPRASQDAQAAPRSRSYLPLTCLYLAYIARLAGRASLARRPSPRTAPCTPRPKASSDSDRLTIFRRSPPTSS